ncbi:hypothetical protein FACS189459_5650 [Bacilli bacterium]|nr:hypothetical protein FACS189459_5650 [Bacilli bacterium]
MNRELKQIFKESGEKNFTNENYAELGTKIISRIEETMANFNSNDTMTSSKDAVADYEKCLLNNDDKNDNAGLMSGIEPIDNVLRGFKSGKMIIVAARPGIGKSAFALNCAANVAKQLMKNNKSKNVNQKKECIIMFSLEMETKELVGRIISSESKVSFNMCEFEKLGGFQKNSIMAALNDLREMPIFFGTSSSTSMLDIENTLKKYSTTHKIRMVIIDYLGLIDSNLAKRANEEREIAARNSKTIKRLAMHYHIPILLLSQLNRDVESRETHNFTSKTGNNIILEPEPKLRDLALSGSIEQDADIVCFLCKERANDKSDKITIKFIIEKNRDGGNGKIKLLFDRPVQSFIAIKDEKGE